MGFEDHKKDYVSDLWRGKHWQMGSRKGQARQAGPNRWLEFESMERQGRPTQVGHVSFAPGRMAV